jgi:hypothetical protein
MIPNSNIMIKENGGNNLCPITMRIIVYYMKYRKFPLDWWHTFCFTLMMKEVAIYGILKEKKLSIKLRRDIK